MGEYLRSIIILALSLSFFEMLLPERSSAKLVKLVFSIILIIAVIEPVISFLA